MTDSKKRAMEARLRRKERELKELEEELAKYELVQEKFYPRNWPTGYILKWSRNFGNPGGITYTFAAVAVKRYGNIVWYLTGRQQNPLTWNELVEDHLGPADAEGFAVWVAGGFNRIN